MPVNPKPEGFHAVTPYVAVEDADPVIDFLRTAFGAEIIRKVCAPDGRLVTATIRIGDANILLAETNEVTPCLPLMLYHYVADVDAVFAQAMAAGGEEILEPMDMFYGDRAGAVRDPAGNSWWIATQIEELSEDELTRRIAEQTPPKSA